MHGPSGSGHGQCPGSMGTESTLRVACMDGSAEGLKAWQGSRVLRNLGQLSHTPYSGCERDATPPGPFARDASRRHACGGM
mmetsp:Transcript_30938/g.87670  ORF Transcript_30938/g.87670 Transcript_30938/m.87670 type:complete len:81 (-) Transcript_30938:4850-5092(-)